jgi:hypothetical protein
VAGDPHGNDSAKIYVTSPRGCALAVCVETRFLGFKIMLKEGLWQLYVARCSQFVCTIFAPGRELHRTFLRTVSSKQWGRFGEPALHNVNTKLEEVKLSKE